MLSLSEYEKSFKSYDIRGVRGSTIDGPFGYYLGRGLGETRKQEKNNPSILIACDTRHHNREIMDYCITGLHDAGITNITNAGLQSSHEYPYGVCSTTMAYILNYKNYDYVICFSASHNPPEYIGFKIMNTINDSISPDKLKEVWKYAYEKYQGSIHCKHTSEILGSLQSTENIEKATQGLRDNLKEKYHGLKKSYSFSVDFGHGAAISYEKDFLDKLDRADYLFDTPDGNFPAHLTDTSRFDNYQKLLAHIQENKKDFGIMFDGDADRLGVILTDGTIVPGDIITAIVAKNLLTDGSADTYGSKKVFYEVFCSAILPETIKKYGGEAIMTRVGRGAFCTQFIKEKGLLAGEVSGHILFAEAGNCEYPLLVLYYLLKESEQYDSFSEMIKDYQKYFKTQVLHFAIVDKDGLIQHIQKLYAHLEQYSIDGIRIEGDGFRFTVRKSGTEDIVKVVLEASSKEIYDRELQSLKNTIVNFGGKEE